MARLQKRILLVEDDKWSSDAIAMLLDAEGYDTVVASSARAAVEALSCYHVDAVLLDLWLRNTSGIDVGDQITNGREYIPIVLMSATNPEELERAAQRLGAAAVLRKPFDSASLFTTIERVTSVGVDSLRSGRSNGKDVGNAPRAEDRSARGRGN